MSRWSITVPPGLTESDLLEWVEGQLAPQRQAAIDAVLRDQPELFERLHAMRADRQMLAAERFEAPAGLVERARAQAEREALLGLSRARASRDTIPISAVVPGRRRRWPVAVFADAGRGLAVAAGVVLVVSGAVYLALEAMQRWNAAPGDAAGRSASRETAGDAVDDDASAVTRRAAASRDGGPSGDGATPGGLEEDSADAMALAHAGEESSVPEPAAAADESISAQAAVELARQSRLIVVVEVSRASAVGGVLDRLAAADRAGRLRTGPALSAREAEVIAAAGGVGAQTLPESGRQAGSPPAIAGPDRPVSPMGPVGGTGLSAWSAGSSSQLVRLVELAPDVDAIRALTSVLSTGSEVRVALRAAEAPLTLPAPRRTAEDLLWWTMPVSAWQRRVVLPVVIVPGR